MKYKFMDISFENEQIELFDWEVAQMDEVDGITYFENTDGLWFHTKSYETIE